MIEKEVIFNMKEIMEEKLSEIQIPKSLHERCAMGTKKAKQEMEEKKMKNHWKKGAAVAAVMVLCLFTMGNSAVADTVKGFFRDIKGWNGAVTGTEYITAEDEVTIEVKEVTADEKNVFLKVELAFLKKEEIPFCYAEFVSINKYEILDENGTVMIQKENAEETYIINDGTALLTLSVEKEKLVEGNTYVLEVEEFETLKKADAPLHVKGSWECEFKLVADKGK